MRTISRPPTARCTLAIYVSFLLSEPHAPTCGRLAEVTRRRITLKGVKPLVKVQWQFDAFYLYGAVEPLTGEVMIQDYNRVNTENFQHFLDDFSEQYPHDFHVIQTDNASSHRSSDLVMPDNVMLLYQPPYSPQVNSSERLWDWS